MEVPELWTYRRSSSAERVRSGLGPQRRLSEGKTQGLAFPRAIALMALEVAEGEPERREHAGNPTPARSGMWRQVRWSVGSGRGVLLKWRHFHVECALVDAWLRADDWAIAHLSGD